MKKISEIFLRDKWLKKEEFDKKIKSLIEEYSKELKKVSDYNYELLEDKGKYYNLYKVAKETNEEHQVMNGLLRKENDELKAQIKKINGQKGILTRKVNSLTKELEETKKQLEVIDKAREIISKEFLCYDNESDEYIQGVKLLDILKEVE